MIPRCGCGRLAEYEVYEDRQPHCEEHMKEATECAEPVLVRKPIDWSDFKCFY